MIHSKKEIENSRNMISKTDKSMASTLLASLIIALVLGLMGPITTLAASPATINLGTASNFTVLSKTGISATGVTSVVGDIGVSPAAATYITGFALTLPTASAFSTSAQVTGKVYAPDYANPTPTSLTTAIADMQTAYTYAIGQAPTVIELGAGNIGGLTLTAGVYKWGTGLVIPTDVTLFGSANDVWIFQVAQNLNLSPAKKIILSGGTQASNIFWVVAGQTTIGTTAVFNGNILDQTAIVLNTGAVLNGRALAQTAVTLDSNTVTAPVFRPASTPAIPAIPATPAVPTSNTNTSTIPTTPAIPATPAVPATPANPDSQNQNNQLFTNSNEEQVILQNTANQTDNTHQIQKFVKNLGKGNRGNDVKTLQQFLIDQNIGKAAQALNKVGATAYFGTLTRSALAEFQAKFSIKPAWGNFGPITRAYLSTNYNQSK